MMNRKLVVLDIDETLVHACNEWIGHSCAFTASNYMVHIRPGAQDFLDLLFERYDVSIWTASAGQYLSEVVKKLFAGRSLRFIWDRTYCDIETDENGYSQFIKNLSRLDKAGFDEYLIIDDRPENIRPTDDNVIAVTPYYGSLDDTELSRLTKYLLAML